MIQKWSPYRQVHLALPHAREPVVGRPGVEEVAIERRALAECDEIPGEQV